MITETHDITEELLNTLEKNHYSRRIKSHFLAYGVSYDFCRFYFVREDQASDNDAVISIFNASMVVSVFEGHTLSDNEISELATLIFMTKPVTVELGLDYSKRLSVLISEDYNVFDRTMFEFVCKNHIPKLDVNELPKLDDVYDILATSFPAIRNSYSLWLTDTSHRVRKGLSQSFTLKNCSSATIQYIIDGIAFVGHVATIPKERGKHHARELLYWLGERLNEDGFSVQLFARSYNVSYYTEIGFLPIYDDIVLERKDIDE